MPIHLDGYFCRTLPLVKFNEEKQEYEIVEGGEEAEESWKWMFLFVDLVFVALISKLAAVMENCAISFHSMSFVCTMMTMMFMTRLYLDEYCGRFYVNDLFHRLIYFMYTMSMFVMALNINTVPTDGAASDALCNANLYGVGFGMAFLMSRFLMFLLYLSVIWADYKVAMTQFIGPCIRCCISFFIVASLVASDSAAENSGQEDEAPFAPAYRMNIYLAAIMIELGHSFIVHIFKAVDKAGWTMDHLCGHTLWHILCGTEHYNLDIESYQERIGAFLLMVLGEAVIGLLVPYFDVNDADETYKFSTISCFIIFCYGLEYFDAANSKDKGQHAMTHSVFMSFMYTYIHIPLAFGMFFTASGMAICYEESLDAGKEGAKPVEEVIPPSDKEKTDDKASELTWDHEEMFGPTVLLAGSIGCTIICLAIMRNLHVGLDRLFARGEGKRRCEFFLKCFFGVIHWSVPEYGFRKNSYNAFTHACFLAAMIIYEAKVGGKEEEGEEGEESSEKKGETTHRAVGISALASKQTLEKKANDDGRSNFASRLMTLAAQRKERNSLTSSSSTELGSSPGSRKSVPERVSEGRLSMSAKRSSLGGRKSIVSANAPEVQGDVELMQDVDNPMKNTRRL